MRTIKFRVWDNLLKNFEDSNENWHNDAVEIYCPPRSNLNEALDCLINDCENRYTIQQFTGLIDNNGKRIFEGDILERVGGSGSFCKIVVSWHEKECCFVYNNVSNLHGPPNPLHDNFVNLADWTYWVVCGNIFENPELFK